MDKYEYRVKAEQIVKLVGRKNYIEAMKIADEIDWNRVKNIQMLCTVSDIYAKNERYEESREILFLALERSPSDRMIMYNIVELSLIIGDMKSAVTYFREYSQLAPTDSNIYILKYKLYAANSNTSIETLISILEEFKELEFHEDWGFELATLYAEGGYIEQCVELCDELDLWFNEGPYVMQALELKQQFAELTPSQQAKLEQSYAMLNEAEHMQQMFVEEEQARMQEEQMRAEEEQARMEEEQARLLEEKMRAEEEQARLLEEQMRAREEQQLQNEEDIFFAGKVSQPEVERIVPKPVQNDVPKAEENVDKAEEPETWVMPDRSIVIEEGEANERLEVINDISKVGIQNIDDGEEIDDDEEEFGKKSRSGGFLSTIGRLSKRLVEPASDYDMEEDAEDEEDEEDDEIFKDDVEEDISRSIQQPQVKKFTSAGRFNLDDIAAAQEVYEENTETEIERTHHDENSSENISKISPEKKRVSRDTKPFDKVAFKEKKSRKTYEEDIEDALKNLDKVVNGNMDASKMKEEMEKDDATPAWNGVSRYDTMNLQKELAKSIQKLLEATEKDDVDSTLEDVKRLVEDSNIPELTETMRFRTVRSSMLNNWAKNQADKLNSRPEIEDSIRIGKENYVKEEIKNDYVAPIPRKQEVEVIPSLKLKPTKEDRKRELEQILTLENDGQIGLVVPEEEVVEKQITGQLNIQDVLLEFERQKNSEITEVEKRELEKARSKALNETQEFMSQVMDVLNKCLPNCGDNSVRSNDLHNRLSKIQSELNSTDDLSQISKLNAELAEILDKICPIQSKDAEEKVNESEVASTEEVSEPKDVEVSEEISETSLEDDVVGDVQEEPETEAKEAQEEPETEAKEAQEEPETEAEVPQEEPEAEAKGPQEEQQTAKSEDDISADEISRMLEAALYDLGQDVQNSANNEEKTDSIPEGTDEDAKVDSMLEGTDEYAKVDSMPEDMDEDAKVDSMLEGIKENDELKQLSEIFGNSVDEEASTPVHDENKERKKRPSSRNAAAKVAKQGATTKAAKQSAASLSGLAASMKNNNLNDKQREALSYFANISDVANQVDKLLNVDHKGTENMIITGPDGSGKTSLALRIIKAQQDESNQDLVVAKIKGASLNSQDLGEVFEKVNGGVLVIEKAAALSDTTMKKLCEKLDMGEKIQIILVTKKKSVERLVGRNPEFMNRFNVTLDLPNYNNDELVEYGKTYAKANGYNVEDMAVLALFSRIGSMQTDHGAPNFNDVKEVIDQAINHAERRNKKIIKRLFGKKSDDSTLYLLEDDF